MKSVVLRLLVMTASLLLLAPPAHAADELGLSRDGKVWSHELQGSLFDSALRWVPGDERAASFFVRNQSTGRGTLTVDVVGSSVDSLLRTDDLSVAARVGNGAWKSISTPGRQRLASTSIRAKERTKVDVRVTFSGSSGNYSQIKQLQLDLDVRLTQYKGNTGTDGSLGNGGQGTFGNGSTNNGSSTDGSPGARGDGGLFGHGLFGTGLLPNTGAMITPSLMLGAAALLMAGSWMIGARRRREEGDHE